MLPHGQWCSSGKDSKGCHSSFANELGWAKESLGRAGQTVQEAAGRYGKVEGKMTLSAPGFIYHSDSLCRRRIMCRSFSSKDVFADRMQHCHFMLSVRALPT